MIRAYERDLYPTSDIRRMLEGLAPLNAKRTDEDEEGEGDEEEAAPVHRTKIQKYLDSGGAGAGRMAAHPVTSYTQ